MAEHDQVGDMARQVAAIRSLDPARRPQAIGSIWDELVRFVGNMDTRPGTKVSLVTRLHRSVHPTAARIESPERALKALSLTLGRIATFGKPRTW